MGRLSKVPESGHTIILPAAGQAHKDGQAGTQRWITLVDTMAVVAEPSVLTKPEALKTELGAVVAVWSWGRIAEAPRNVKFEPDTARLLRKGCASSPKMNV